MTDISAYFELRLGNDPWSDRIEEAVGVANEKLAGHIERRLRQEVDFGLDANLAAKAQSIRVRAEGDRLVVDTRSQDEVIDGEKEEPAAEEESDLFRMGSGIPEVNPDGTLTYRKVSLDTLFKDQQENLRDQQIAKVAESTAQLHLGSVVAEAVAEVDRRYLGR